MKDMGDLTGRVAVITGGGGGIGAAVCETLAFHGAIVVPADIKPELCDPVVERVKAAGGQAYAVAMNVMELESVKKAFQEVYDKFVRIDILVNIAGILSGDTIFEVTPEHWDKMLDINLRGIHFCCQSVIPYMEKSGGGSVVSVSSQAGQVGGWMGSVAYSASKGGILAITKGYARQCTAKYGIRFNDVAPGLIETPLTKERGDKPDGIPVGRLGTAQDVANAIYFLASDLSAFVDGATIDVNGGMFMRS